MPTRSPMTRLGTAEEQAAAAAGLPPPVKPVERKRIRKTSGIDGSISITFNRQDRRYRVTARVRDHRHKRAALQHEIPSVALSCWQAVCEMAGEYDDIPAYDVPEAPAPHPLDGVV